MQRPPLFRAESEQARATSWLGRIVLIRPLSFTFLACAALALAAGLGAFFVVGEYTRKARVTGLLVPAEGVVKIISTQAGIVEAVHVREGDGVGKDAAIFFLADARVSRAREEIGVAVGMRLEARREALERQRDHALDAMRSEQAALAERRAGMRRELDRIESELAAQEGRAGIAREGSERARRLEGLGFLSQAARAREEASALEELARLEAARRTRLALERESAAIAFEMSTARSRAGAQRSAIELQLAALEQERIEREVQYRTAIVAPAPGTIAAVLVERGQMVNAGTTLATLIPLGAPLEAHLFAPSRSIGFVREGQRVLLRYLAFPFQKFGSHGARVLTVSRNPLAPGELGFSPADGSREPVYRIKAALELQSIHAYGRPEPLQPGMQVEADILLDRRRLIEWIFEPLFSLAGRA